jgi:hypothetical protein
VFADGSDLRTHLNLCWVGLVGHSIISWRYFFCWLGCDAA